MVQADELQTELSQVIVAMISSKLFRGNHPSRVLIELSTPCGEQSRLLTDSVIMTDNLAKITETAIDKVIGNVPMSDVDQALRYTLGLDR